MLTCLDGELTLRRFNMRLTDASTQLAPALVSWPAEAPHTPSK